jgi:hypothetical protein
MEYQQRFPKCTLPDWQVFNNVHWNLRESSEFSQLRHKQPLQCNVDSGNSILEMVAVQLLLPFKRYPIKLVLAG